jgi:hypothetical protein
MEIYVNPIPKNACLNLLQRTHDGTSNVREQKYCLAKRNYESLKIK